MQKSWPKKNLGKPVRGNPRANGLARRLVSCAYPIPDACMSVAMGYMVGVWVMFSVVVSLILSYHVPVVAKLVLRLMPKKPPEAHISIIFLRQGTILFLEALAAVKLSVWIGVLVGADSC
jgi:hypothetical protein